MGAYKGKKLIFSHRVCNVKRGHVGGADVELVN